MNLSSQFLFFFSAIGIFNGLLWCLYCMFFNGKRIVGQYLFGSLLFLMCLRNAKSVMVYFNQTIEYPWLLVVGQSACFMIGPLLHSFVIINNRQIKEWPSRFSWIIGGMAGIVLLGILLYPINVNYMFWRNESRDMVHIALALFIIMSAWELRSYLPRFSDLAQYEIWTILVFAMNALVGLGYVTALLIGEYTLGPLVFSLLVYVLLGYFIFHRNKLDYLFLKKAKSIKSIEHDTANKLTLDLAKLMKEQQLYKKQDIRIQDVAEAMNIPKHQLSQLLNENLGLRFSSYINEYRINEACKILNGKTSYTLEGVGQEVGFKSKSTFFTTFKLLKGMTPMQFQNSNR